MTEPNRRILIVDDNRAIHEDFHKILRRRADTEVTNLEAQLFGAEEERHIEFDLSSAYQGLEGVDMVDKARAAGRPFALAIVDMRMPPGIDGLETIERMWQTDRELQIVICTAYADASWQDIMRRFGTTDRLLILKKPFDLVEVCQLALALTEKWQLAHEAKTRMAELVASRSEVAASLALARAVQEATADGLLVVDPDGKLHSNRRFTEMWNMTPELVSAGDTARMQQIAYAQLVHPETTSAHVTYYEQHPEDSGHDELQLKDGRVFERWTAPVRLQSGAAHGRLWWFRDITERRKLELDRAVVTERMASMGRLAAGVGHEINNPLTYALGNVESLIEAAEEPEGLPGTSELIERLRETRDGLLRIRVIVRDLQTLSRSDESHAEIDLPQVIEQAIQIAGAELRHRAPIIRNYEPIAPVVGSRTRLGQVFLNLIINAAQAIPEGHATDNKIEIAIRDAGNEVVVEISDTGTGIAPEHIERIFDPFFTTKPVGSGTGLGLSVSREIVSRHGGSLSVRSTLGQGSTLTVRLPYGTRVAEHAAQPSPAAQGVRRARVLVIDDEPLISRVLQRGLANHQVVVADQARDALARIEQGETFDVVLCDLMMPDISGMDIHEHLSREHPAIARRMIFMTGGAFTAKAKAFLTNVTNERIDKPFSLAQIKQAVDRTLDRRRRGSSGPAYGRTANGRR
jgi:signal transduction histidine kinase/DNA-binding response OmpR family regulator